MASKTQVNQSVRQLAAQTASTMEPGSNSSALTQALPSAFNNKLPSRRYAKVEQPFKTVLSPKCSR